MLASECKTKDANKSDTDPLSVCIITHELEVLIHDDLSKEETKTLILHLALGLAIGIIILAILLLIFYKCYKKKVEYLKIEM